MKSRMSTGRCCCDTGCLQLFWNWDDPIGGLGVAGCNKDGSAYEVLHASEGGDGISRKVGPTGDHYVTLVSNVTERWACDYTGTVIATMGGGTFESDIDEINEHIYYTLHNEIRRVDFDGSNDTSLRSLGISSVLGVVIDFATPRLYRFGKPVVDYSALDGTGATTIFTPHSTTEAGGVKIAIPFMGTRVFIRTIEADGGTFEKRNRLYSCELDGSDLQLIRDMVWDFFDPTPDGTLGDIAADGDKVFAMRWNTTATAGHEIVSMDHDGTNETVIVSKADTSSPSEANRIFGLMCTPSE